jgi:t-SNARE complex subunit (syntaxin)
MSRQKPSYKKKRSAKQKKRLFYGILIALIFIVSFIVAIVFSTFLGGG